jgi:hypothetical protein
MYCDLSHIDALHFLQQILASVYSSSQPPHNKLLFFVTQDCVCRRLKAIILRGLFRRCDFVVFYVMFCKVQRFIGGGRVPLFQLEEILPHVDISGKCFKSGNSLKFIGHKHKNVAEALYKGLNDHVYGNVPLTEILFKVTVKDAKTVAKLHGVHVPSKSRAGEISSLFKEHSCALCKTHVSVFALHAVKSNSEKCKRWYDNLDASRKKDKQNNAKQAAKNKREALQLKPHEFPPKPPSEDLQEAIARGWCENTSPEEFMEAGCAVCGQLTPVVQLSELSKVGCDLDILVREGMGLTRLERLSKDEPVREVKGPILDETCAKICMSCKSSLKEGLIPKYALANGLWLGSIPPNCRI